MGKGRPKGSLNKTTVFIQELLNEHASEVAEKVIELAKAGDPNAMKIVMDRICPVREGAPVTWNLPEIRSAQDIPAACSSVLRALGEGELAPAECLRIVRVLESVAKLLNCELDHAWRDETTTILERLTHMREEDPAQTEQGRQEDAA
jgi:hypothetical protein